MKHKQTKIKLLTSSCSKVSIKFLVTTFIFTFLLSIIISRNSSSHLINPQFIPTKEIIKTRSWEYFYPFWNKSVYATLFSLYTSKDVYNFHSFKILSYVLKDPEKRIETEFQVPAFMEKRVLFWLIVQTQFDKFVKIVHDRNNLDIIYGYINFEPLYRKFGPTELFEKKALAIEKEIIDKIRYKLLAAVDESSISLTPEERLKIRSFLSRIGALEKNVINSLTKSIRTQTGQKDAFIEALEKAKSLLPIIEATFKNFNLPNALARIPFIESSFNIYAQSKRGAIGIWQFMPETAEEHIDPINTELWADPIHQTRGAARLLTFYRKNLPDWGITLTAYNSGIGKIQRIIKTYNITNINELIEISEKRNLLGFAGINFYSQFLAANLVEAYKDMIFKID